MEKTLGSYIKEEMRKRGFSSRQFAIKCDITPAYISDIEKNKRVPSKEVLERFIRELELSDDEINVLFDLAAINYEDRVAYDIANYIMSTPYLRACIRKTMKSYDDSLWEKVYANLDSEV